MQRNMKKYFTAASQQKAAESCSSPEHICTCKIAFNPIIILMKQKLDATHMQRVSQLLLFFFCCFLISDISPEYAEPGSLIFLSFSYLILISTCLWNIQTVPQKKSVVRLFHEYHCSKTERDICVQTFRHFFISLYHILIFPAEVVWGTEMLGLMD